MTLEDIALQMTPGIGVKGAAHLLEVFGDARRIFAASHDELAGAARLRPEPLRAILQRKGFPAAERELLYCRRNGIRPIASTDPEYPPLLRDIPDPPHVIYLRGELRALHMRCLSVVGTRTATPYGETMCHALIERLAERVDELSIVSGLAFGIGGVVTFKRSQVAASVPAMELDDLVLETDCPYLTPMPHRGERNESAYVRFVCERVAALKGLPPEEVARRTTASAERMFGLGALPAAEEPERAAAEEPGKTAAKEPGKTATEAPDALKTPASEGVGRTTANS